MRAQPLQMKACRLEHHPSMEAGCAGSFLTHEAPRLWDWLERPQFHLPIQACLQPALLALPIYIPRHSVIHASPPV